MRQNEGRLFGNAWLDGDFRKSAVRLRLSTWNGGRATGERWRREAGGNAAIGHPEVRRPIDPLLYLGYGPLVFKEGTVLKSNAAIQAGETAELSIAAPGAAIDDLHAALVLMNAYGTVGGRSRNGWGSLEIEPLDQPSTLSTAIHGCEHQSASQRFFRPWGDTLKLDWPHAIGSDDTGPLVWQTANSYDDWKALMRDLAILKIGLRTKFVFPNARPPHPQPLDRHWLSYPITKHGTGQWNRNARLPNSLRFKVRPDPDDPKRLRGVVFHVPCRPPADFVPDSRAMEAIERVWRTTHELLDELTQRAGRRYTMIDNDERRRTLKPSLDKLTLKRSQE